MLKYRLYPSDSQNTVLAQFFGNACFDLINCYKLNLELTLSNREWQCLYCHSCHDKDINAAHNVLRIGQELPECQKALKENVINTSFSEIGSICL